MMKSLRTNRVFIIVLLLTQLVPLLWFTADTYNLTSQIWWLGALLAFLTLIADFQLIVRGTYNVWPWYLMGFAQGFNIISRLMMFFPHIINNQNGVESVDFAFVLISVITMLWSAYLLWFSEFPEVRNTMIKD
ncbi:MAG: hypothetical protein LWX83_18105 [Anaerolineae bacterium]|nr:hypothetical protein [Anaerolineae bacterium]